MKIEISEVFVIRSDAMTLDCKPSAVGIAAVEPRTAPVPPNIKCYRFPNITAFYHQNKKMLKPTSRSRPDTCGHLQTQNKKDCLYAHEPSKRMEIIIPSDSHHRGAVKLL
jgi:hypothetical protein